MQCVWILTSLVAVTASVARSRPSLRATRRNEIMSLLQVQKGWPNYPNYHGQKGPNFEAYQGAANTDAGFPLGGVKGPPDSPGAGPPTSYTKPYDACLACLRFNPTMAPVIDNQLGMPEGAACRYGACDFRDPQTQPWGGVLGGGGSEPDPEGGWYKPAQPALQCFTTSDVAWYDECNPLLYSMATSVWQVSTACEYQQQLNVFGPFVGHKEPFVRLAAGNEDCGARIEDGWRLYDDKDSFNSNLEKLSGCCETVHQYFTCVGDKKKILMGDDAGLMKLDEVSNHSVAHFSLFCVPKLRLLASGTLRWAWSFLLPKKMWWWFCLCLRKSHS